MGPQYIQSVFFQLWPVLLGLVSAHYFATRLGYFKTAMLFTLIALGIKEAFVSIPVGIYSDYYSRSAGNISDLALLISYTKYSNIVSSILAFMFINIVHKNEYICK